MRSFVVITVFTSLLTVTSGALQPMRAFADTETTLRVSGLTVIGEYGSRTWAVTFSLLGCTWRAIGEAPLAEPAIVRGTDGDDTIRVIQVPVFWCNRILQPVAQNGHAIRLYGGEGDDLLYGGGSAPFSGNPNQVFGEAGDDTLYVGPGGARAEGGPGDDYVYGGDSPGDELFGGPGDDILCERADVKPLILDGGEDEDVSCASSAVNQYQSVERNDCGPCRFGY